MIYYYYTSGDNDAAAKDRVFPTGSDGDGSNI